MRQRKGEANPNYKHGGRVGKQNREGQRRFQSGQTICQAPDCEESAMLYQHHVVYRQHVRKKNGDEWDGRNALALCAACHASHHRRGRVLLVSALRPENVAFAFELLDVAAFDYFERYYVVPESVHDFARDFGLEGWLERYITTHTKGSLTG